MAAYSVYANCTCRLLLQPEKTATKFLGMAHDHQHPVGVLETTKLPGC